MPEKIKIIIDAASGLIKIVSPDGRTVLSNDGTSFVTTVPFNPETGFNLEVKE